MKTNIRNRNPTDGRILKSIDKKCNYCMNIKLKSEFNNDKKMRCCNECYLKSDVLDDLTQKKSYSDWKSSLKRDFNMTEEMYNKMLNSQLNLCKICGLKEENIHTSRKHFHVDHDHKTGKVRGLLCGPCNQGLGLFKENTETMINACKYLLKFSK